MTPIDYFDRGARLRPDAIAFVAGAAQISYRDAQALTHRIALALLAADVGPGTKVAVYSANRIEAFLAVLGVFRCGAVWVPVNVRNGLDDNIAVLANAECSVLFYGEEFESAVATMKRALPAIALSIPLTVLRDDDARSQSWMAPLGSIAPSLPDDPHRMSAILSTGGTTGLPKGVVWRDLTWECMIANFWAHLPCDSDRPPVYLVAAPMTHAAGVISVPLMAAGAKIVILDRVDAGAVMSTIEKERVTHLFLPPTAIYMMLAHPDVRKFDYRSLRYFIYSAAPMAPDKIREAIDVFGPVMAQAYGQAEVPLMGAFLSPAEHVDILASNRRDRLASCGRSSMFVDLIVMDDDGRRASPGMRGEIAFRGNLVAPGYYKDASATTAARRDGWHLTGDIGFMDEEGYVYIVDRKKDMIITGGFNVFSTEVERQILRHPSVQDCAVVGAPDETWGEIVVAICEAKPGAIIPVDELRDRCREALGGVKAPKAFHIWDVLPRSAAGKILKREIRERFWRGRERRV